MTNMLKNAKTLFVIGAPRSGTTMLARLLNSHPNIIQTYETAAFLLFDTIIKNTKRGFEAGMLYGKEYQKLWSDHLAGVAKTIIEDFYNKIIESERRQLISYWGDKHPHHNACLPFLEKLYPDARYIYIIRDPRDVTCSIANMNKWSFEHALDHWKKISDRYEVFQNTINSSRIYRVRYEDIVIDYEDALGNILAWLGLEYDQSFGELVRQKKGKDFHKPAKTASTNFAESSMGRWRTQLSENENQYTLSLAGDYLTKYGYPLDSMIKP